MSGSLSNSPNDLLPTIRTRAAYGSTASTPVVSATLSVVRSIHVDAWTFVWLFLILKIPIVALFLLIRWAVREPDPEPEPRDDGGIGPRSRPLHPHHPRSRPVRGVRSSQARPPRLTRRLLHRRRTRTVIARGRLVQR